MNWDQIVTSWKQLKDKIVLLWGRSAGDDGKRVDLASAEMSPDSQSRDAQTKPVPPRRPRKAERVFTAHWLLIRSHLRKGEA